MPEHPLPSSNCCASSIPVDSKPAGDAKCWNIRYATTIVCLATLWWWAYVSLLPVSTWLVSGLIGTVPEPYLASLHFFLYDTAKIFLLLAALIYGIAWIRASLNVERVRTYLVGKRRGLGYGLGALFGAITPFCSCSSIPLFLGFTMARIPIGITLSFLITSPLINEIAIVLLWGLLGWKFTVLYILVGLSAGIIGGFFMDAIRAERWLQPFILESMSAAPSRHSADEPDKAETLSIRQRHQFAYGEMLSIFKRIWKWVILGVGIGAALHGFVPENWFAEHLGAGEWWTVPTAVFVAIPLYSSVSGIVPIMESLLVKGLPLGTTLAFCMSAVAASIPEVMLLRQIMTIKLQAAFIGYLWVIFTLIGWLFNVFGPSLIPS